MEGANYMARSWPTSLPARAHESVGVFGYYCSVLNKNNRSEKEPRSFIGEEPRLILCLMLEELSIATPAYCYGQESPTRSSREVLPALRHSSRAQNTTSSFFKVPVLQSSPKQLMKAPAAVFPQPRLPKMTLGYDVPQDHGHKVFWPTGAHSKASRGGFPRKKQHPDLAEPRLSREPDSLQLHLSLLHLRNQECSAPAAAGAASRPQDALRTNCRNADCCHPFIL